ncbi:MAG: glutaredoxin family protein [Gammaproteobacteria bacterium]
MSKTLTVYSRQGCPLCDDLVLDLEMALRGREIGIQIVDIDSDPALIEAYALKIPVLCDGATELCFGRLDPAVLAGLSD